MFRSSLSSRVCIAVLTFSFGPSASLLGQGSIIYRQIPYQEFQQIVGEPWRPKYGNIPGLKKEQIPDFEGIWCWEYEPPHAYTFLVFGTPVTKKDKGAKKPGDYAIRWKPYGAAQTVAGPIPVFIRTWAICASDHFSEEWVIYSNKSSPQSDAEAPRSIFPAEPPISPKGLILIIERPANGRWRVIVGDFLNYKAWEGIEDFYVYLGRIGALRKVQGEAAGD
ncbi:MAG: hypothetical protein RMK19_09205, partial [Bacteroidia bacterium]|nr:hypothetical protein [Bacteroidia bacterium]